MTEGSESDAGNTIDSPSQTITTTMTTNISKGQLFGPFHNPLHWLSLKSCDTNNNDDNNNNNNTNSSPMDQLFAKVEIARHSGEQNLKVIYKNGNFYFKAMRDINLNNDSSNSQTPPETGKLYAWFSHDLESRLPSGSSSCLNGSTRYFCPLCNQVFLYSNCVVTHILCICPKRIQIDSIPLTTNNNSRHTDSKSSATTGITSTSNGSTSEVKPITKKKRGFDIASLVREESNESFPGTKRNKLSPHESVKCDQMVIDSSAFHRPKSPTLTSRKPSLTSLETHSNMMSTAMMSSAFKKVDNKINSITNPYDFSTLYQRMATTSMLTSGTSSAASNSLLNPMTFPMPSTATIPTSLSSTHSKPLVSNTLLPYLPPSLAALTFPTTNWCAKCNASFRMTSDLVYHMRSHHKTTIGGDTIKKKREEKLRCNICNETFRERHHLTRHMTSHQ
ncbi:PR domain zinc finger protein 8-like [Oppia nitens]|uniref:PR domain zinc finger protein 8-like n=1 Tax=Oppia nitens TaxID=1686743 RepID=UPI0023DAEBEF|nr:PR domain zinc finger protein 8-like [Oppia nitens]